MARKPATSQPYKDAVVSDTIHALDRLMKVFAPERYFYLFCSVASFILLFAVVIVIVSTKQITLPELGTIFGSGGMIGLSTFRV